MSFFDTVTALAARLCSPPGERLGNVGRNAPRRSLGSRRPWRPRLEELETRWLLSGYRLAAAALVGQPAPGPEGGTLAFDLEPGALNNQGQLIFGAGTNDNTGYSYGVFVAGKEHLTQLMRMGEKAPGGGTFGGAFIVWAPAAINNAGDAAFAASLEPFTVPFSVNIGVYRYDHANGKLSAVVVPGVTPVPGSSRGETFAGAFVSTALNDRGDLAFTGTVAAHIGPGASVGLGEGIFLADPHGHLSKVVRPGDPAPGGFFDYAVFPSINNRGDVAFSGHLSKDPILTRGLDLPAFIFTDGGAYLKDGKTGVVRAIAHQGDPIPKSAGGGTYDAAYAPLVNNRGQVAFGAALAGVPVLGDLSRAIFLDTDGNVIAIARKGTALPGGGHLLTGGHLIPAYALNNNGDVAFNAVLDTGEQGAYLWSHGKLTLVAKTGTVVPGLGTIASLDQYGSGFPDGYMTLNDRGQLGFVVQLVDGRLALVLASPEEGAHQPPPGVPGRRSELSLSTDAAPGLDEPGSQITRTPSALLNSLSRPAWGTSERKQELSAALHPGQTKRGETGAVNEFFALFPNVLDVQGTA